MSEENIFIRQLKKHPLSFLFRLIKNIVFALFLFNFVLVILYIVGNYQEFQVESQQLLLNVITFTSITLLILSVLIFFETGIRLFTKEDKIRSLILLLLMIINVIFGFLCMSFSNIVYYLSEGF